MTKTFEKNAVEENSKPLKELIAATVMMEIIERLFRGESLHKYRTNQYSDFFLNPDLSHCRYAKTHIKTIVEYIT